MDGCGKERYTAFGMTASPQSPQTRSHAPAETGEPNKKSRQIFSPAITLPKGGGAIRGSDEKFGVNPVTGMSSLSVPIYASPERSGIGPQLSLLYESGAGNSPFGFGWSLALPAITRKTDKGLSRYCDAVESDVYILSSDEDLVPVLVKDGENCKRDAFSRTVDGVLFRIHRYRPQFEGLIARIERWTQVQSGEIYWLAISKDNITTLYGKNPESRITDPDDPLRVFSWLICESFDDRDNAIQYEYKPENAQGVELDAAHELNRTPRKTNEDLSQPTDWLFELVFDYGELYREDAEGLPTAVSIKDNQGEWTMCQGRLCLCAYFSACI